MISPLLSNLYLHHVLDLWFEQEVKSRLGKQAFMVRFADDAVIVTRKESDARRLLEVLPKRFAKYGLQLHPEKTRLVGFCKPIQNPKKEAQLPNSTEFGSFDFLGMTQYWGKSRRGYWIVKCKTAKVRLARAITAVRDWCAQNRHMPIPSQYRKLRVKMLGHYNYYGVISNSRSIGAYYQQVRRAWQWSLSHRGGKRRLTWERYMSILKRFPLPPPRIVHSPYIAAKP